MLAGARWVVSGCRRVGAAAGAANINIVGVSLALGIAVSMVTLATGRYVYHAIKPDQVRLARRQQQNQMYRIPTQMNPASHDPASQVESERPKTAGLRNLPYRIPAGKADHVSRSIEQCTQF